MSGIEVDVERAQDYRTIVVNGVFGGHRPGFFEVLIYTNELIGDDVLRVAEIDPKRAKLKRILQCRLVMDPIQAKSFAKWLQNHLDSYEKDFHEIPAGPKDSGKSPPSGAYG